MCQRVLPNAQVDRPRTCSNDKDVEVLVGRDSHVRG